MTDTQTTADVQIQQTFAFDDSEKQFIQTVREGEDPSHDWGSYSDVDLANWLERPILAATKIWNVGDPFPSIYFNPWSAFLDSPSVAQKLSNFYLLRCKMHMKVMVNGSQMHYGRGLVSYRPLMTVPGERFQPDDSGAPSSGPFDVIKTGAVSTALLSNGDDVCLMTQSQWPKIFIDPGQSMGGEMEFPFFFGANWFRIPNRDWVANPSAVNTGITDSLGDGVVNTINGAATNIALGPYGARASHMGVVHSCSLAPLKHANGADDPVTIQVFLWASDIKFSVPTAVPHPVVGEFPGYRDESFPRMEFENHMRAEYVPNFLGDLAKSSSPDIAGRLELGDSSLATHDSTVGLGSSEEMSIKALAQRECWLDRFIWRVEDPAETPIWSCRVTPQYFKRQFTPTPDATTGIPCMQPTPSAYASLPFGYWRGSMKYRIQIVASNLHRGRLRIVYDPVADIHARSNVNDYPEALMNQQYSRTIDIAADSGRDFCFEVGYMQEKPYLSLLQLEARRTQNLIDQDYDWANYGSNVPTPSNSDRLAPTQTTNGQITIYVLNRLAVPATSAVGQEINNDVVVNVFTSAGEDMDFQMPSSRNLDMMSFTGPTGFPTNWENSEIPEAIGNEGVRRQAQFRQDASEPRRAVHTEFVNHMNATPAGESASMGATEMENVPQDPPTKAWMGDCSQPAKTMASVTFGENIQSWSDLMNRWQLYNREAFCRPDRPRRESPTRGEDEYTVLTIIPNFPPFPGPAPMPATYEAFTSVQLFGNETIGPYIDGTSTPLNHGVLAANAGYNVAPAAKYTLNAPITEIPEPGETFVDSARLLQVNPGQLTMLHFVTRMFIGRKGAIRNKYILDGNTVPRGTQGTQIMSVKRLPDSGVISGNTYLPDVGLAYTNATTPLETASCRYALPGFGGFWSQASCRLENATSAAGTPLTTTTNVPNVVKAQALNGSMQTGTSNSGAPNWFNPRDYPASPDYAPPLNQTTTVDETVAKSDLMMSNTYDGTHITTTRQQPVIEVEIPFYVNSRFIKNDLVLNNTRGVQAHLLKYETHLETESPEDIPLQAGTLTYFERHVRPGKDFALYYLANVPHIVMLGNFLFPTLVGETGDPSYGIETCAYGSLRYRNGNRQSTSAYRESGVTPIPAGSTSVNTVPQDTYFYDVTALAQAYPLNLPSDAY